MIWADLEDNAFNVTYSNNALQRIRFFVMMHVLFTFNVLVHNMKKSP